MLVYGALREPLGSHGIMALAECLERRINDLRSELEKADPAKQADIAKTQGKIEELRKIISDLETKPARASGHSYFA